MTPRGCRDCIWGNCPECCNSPENRENGGVGCTKWEWRYA